MNAESTFSAERRIRFSTKDLIVWTTCLAIAMAIMTPVTRPASEDGNLAGFLILTVIFLFVELLFFYRQWSVLGGLTGLVIIFQLLIPPVGHPRAAAKRTICQNNLKQLTLALHNFESANNFLPESSGASGLASAKYPYSWRVAILPYVEQQALYNSYRFDEPWNSTHNSKLGQVMPEVFQCPKHKNKRGDCTTAYVAITGPGTLFPVDRPGKMRDATLGLSNTIALIECPDNRVHWMKPDDISLDEAIALYSQTKTTASTYHSGGCNATRGDGSVSFQTTNPVTGDLLAVLQAMKSAAGQKETEEKAKPTLSSPSRSDENPPDPDSENPRPNGARPRSHGTTDEHK